MVQKYWSLPRFFRIALRLPKRVKSWAHWHFWIKIIFLSKILTVLCNFLYICFFFFPRCRTYLFVSRTNGRRMRKNIGGQSKGLIVDIKITYEEFLHKMYRMSRINSAEFELVIWCLYNVRSNELEFKNKP